MAKFKEAKQMGPVEKGGAYTLVAFSFTDQDLKKYKRMCELEHFEIIAAGKPECRAYGPEHRACVAMVTPYPDVMKIINTEEVDAAVMLAYLHNHRVPPDIIDGIHATFSSNVFMGMKLSKVVSLVDILSGEPSTDADLKVVRERDGCRVFNLSSALGILGHALRHDESSQA